MDYSLFIYYNTIFASVAEFIGREKELRTLQEIYELRKFMCCAVIGRRRIGKSSLIEKFVEDKRSLYFEFVEGTPETNLRIMEIVIGDYLGEKTAFESFVDAFSSLGTIAKREKLVIIFDEFTYALSYESFSSLTKNMIDRDIGESFLIISGSLVKMMESETGRYEKPLYGRTQRMYLGGVGLADSKRFHPNMPDLDVLRLHIMTGGSPYYLSRTPAESLDDYIEKYILPTDSMFHDEGLNILVRELDSPRKCTDVLDALAVGRNDTRRISDYSGIDETTCRKVLSELTEFGIIEPLHPMFGTSSKPIRYRFADGMVSLYFRIFRMMPPKSNAGYSAYRGRIATELGRLFESYCARFLSENYPITEIGTWYSAVPSTMEDGTMMRSDGRTATEMIEIDIAATANDGENNMEIFAECKLRNTPIGLGALKDLESKIANVHGKRNYRVMLISGSGFTDELMEKSDVPGVILIGPDALFGRTALPPL